MQADISLIYPPAKEKFYQPLSLPILAGYLENRGFKVNIIDSVALDYTIGDVIEELHKQNPRVIGVAIPFSTMITSAISLLKGCRKEFPNKILISGGYHATIRPEEVSPYCDTVVIGDGEYPVEKILKEGHKGKYLIGDPFDCKRQITPAWHLLPLASHNTTLYLTTRERAFPIVTGRGCPYKCAFCCNSEERQIVRFRDLDTVITELKQIIERFGIHGFHVMDETFTLKKDRVIEFCNKILENNLDIRWSCQTRANLIDEEIVKICRKAGCLRMSLGVESGDPFVLETIDKKINLKQAIDGIRMINEAGITSYGGFMIGHAYDTIDSVCRTIEFMDELDPHFIGYRIAIPYPGCKFRRQAESMGTILTNDFSEYKDDAVVYIPPGLEGYDIGKIKAMGEAYFYWKESKRIDKVRQQDLMILYNNSRKYGKIIQHMKKRGENIDIRSLIERYCKC